MSDVADVLKAELAAMIQQRDELDAQIRRHTAAIAALNGDPGWSNRRSRTAGKAILAALTSFKGPVSTKTLLDHDDLVHYSRQTLRGSLSELHRSGQIEAAERGPKGYIWKPPE